MSKILICSGVMAFVFACIALALWGPVGDLSKRVKRKGKRIMKTIEEVCILLLRFILLFIIFFVLFLFLFSHFFHFGK